MIFYDFEVFQQDWLVVFIDSNSHKETVIVNNQHELETFYKVNKTQIFIGYNNKHYDQWIMKGILAGLNPKNINDQIIYQGKEGWMLSSLMRNYPMINYDVSTRLDRGLKAFEGFFGGDIRETSVPFDMIRKLTETEIQETIHYCRSDVENTIRLFMERISEFKSKIGLVKLASPDNKLNLYLLEKTPIQLSALILQASKQEYVDEFDIDFPDTLRLRKYSYVRDWYRVPGHLAYKDINNNNNNNQLKTDIAGVEHFFGWGGVHGARLKYHGKGYFINMDVASLYPSLMIRYNLMSRSMKNPKKYEEIYHARLKYKAEHNPIQAPLKIVLNGTYGAMKDKTNPLYDPRQANRVCVYGQLLILDLIEHLEPYCEVIQSNTDGILIKMPESENPDKFYEHVDDIAYEWEKRTGLNLEFDEYVEVYQKDVNNYVIIAPDGHYKSKGAYVKKLGRLDYDLPIVNEAIIKFITEGVQPMKTIMECDQLIKFQMVRKISNKYKYAKHGNRRLNERCLRIFASTNYQDPGVYKIHNNGGVNKINDTPAHAMIINGSVTDKPIPNNLDKRWYVDLAIRRLEDFGFSLNHPTLF
jgi:PII-like signaling protein